MPGAMTPTDGKYRVTWGGHVTAKATTRAKAAAQLRGLYAEEKSGKFGVTKHKKRKVSRLEQLIRR